jgi:hypothetical protein
MECMKFLEKNLEDIIWESDNEKLFERGLPIRGKCFRQLNLGVYGIADLVCVQRYGPFGLRITIYELKKDKIGISAFLQSIRYARGIQRYLNLRGVKFSFIIDVILVGREIDTTGNFCFLPDLFCDEYGAYSGCGSINFYTYKYELDGLHFKNISGYYLTNENFKIGGDK